MVSDLGFGLGVGCGVSFLQEVKAKIKMLKSDKLVFFID
jgi:hypothetical protein